VPRLRRLSSQQSIDILEGFEFFIHSQPKDMGIIYRHITPAEAGVQEITGLRRFVDSGLRRNDKDVSDTLPFCSRGST